MPVASAVIMYEAQRQRQAAGLYDNPANPIAENTVQKVLFERGHPVLAKVAKRKGLPYPLIDEQGEVIASEDWWREMQQK